MLRLPTPIVALALALGLALAAPSAALASSASFNEDGILKVDGVPGELNTIVARPGGSGVIVADSAGIQAPGPPFADLCSQTSPTEITCVGERLIVAAGDGDDSVTIAPGLSGARVEGGPGNDRLQSGTIAEIRGEDGNDTIVGSDVVLSGGLPQSLADVLVGGPGDDTLAGGAGDDDVTGSEGNDTVSGGAGDDNLDGFHLSQTREEGADGNDVLRGGDGNDSISGDTGRDRSYGEAGSDFLVMRADFNDKRKPQRGDCGPGKDRASPGSKDRIAGCEQILLAGACDSPCKDRAIVERVSRRGKRRTLLKRTRKIRDGRLDLLTLPRRLLRKRKLTVLIHSESRSAFSGPDGYLEVTLARRI